MGSENKPKLTNAVNMPDRHNPGMRIIGWRVTREEAGLSDALFFLNEVRAAYEALDELRDKFAGQALVGLVAKYPTYGNRQPASEILDDGELDARRKAIAHGAYRYADAMLAERAKSQSGE